MRLFLKILFFLLSIFQINIVEAKVVVFNNVVSEIKLNSEIIEYKNEVAFFSKTDFVISCKSLSELIDY